MANKKVAGSRGKEELEGLLRESLDDSGGDANPPPTKKESKKPKRRKVSGSKGVADTSPSPPTNPLDSENPPVSKKRKTKTSTATIVTDEAVARALDEWDREKGKVVITQRELGNIFKLFVLSKIANSLVVGYLERRGILKSISSDDRSPKVEITEEGFAFLERYRMFWRGEEVAKEKEQLLKKVLESLSQVAAPLEFIQGLQEVSSQKKEIEAQEKEVLGKIEDLRKALEEAEAGLEKIVSAKKEAFREEQELLAKVREANVEGLFEITKQLSHQK